jgi:hypothetical protein
MIMRMCIQSYLRTFLFGVLSSFFILGVGNAANMSTNTVVDWDEPHTVRGMSTLVRTGSGIALTLETANLPDGEAITIWFVIFNNPENCSGACGEADLGTAEVNPSVVFGAGHIVGNGDHASFAGHLKQNDTTGALFGPGLVDPMSAEVHLVVRGHGSILPRKMPAMIHSVDGGCGVNTCVIFELIKLDPSRPIYPVGGASGCIARTTLEAVRIPQEPHNCHRKTVARKTLQLYGHQSRLSNLYPSIDRRC